MSAFTAWLTNLDEAQLHHGSSLVMIAVGAIVLLLELNPFGAAVAPYGRYAKTSPWWLGPKIPARAAWVIQESWAVIVPIVLVCVDRRCLSSPANLALLGMFLLHYVYRSFIYPFRIRGGKPMPAIICALATCFCAYNGYVQGRCWTTLATRTIESVWDATWFASGCAIFFFGWWINLDSDARLRNLRRPGETGYKIPQGGAFRYVSGANYFGEILEWCGYAIAAQHTAAIAFAFFTFANTAPRASQHHKWYLQKFENYPPERRAVIPFIW